MVRRLLMLLLMGALSAVMLVAAPPAEASHWWGGYHWARTSTDPFTLKVGDNVASTWDTYLQGAITDWNKSTILHLEKVTGQSPRKQCRPTAGQIEVCADRYGFNGWLGLAQVWVSGTHITQATTKMNDSYFNTSTYNTPPWRRLVMCQEIAHDFGLDHQDETFDNANLGTCMDYTNAPSGGVVNGFNYGQSNEHPNSHDYAELVTIYTDHADSTTTVGQSVGAAPGRSGTAADEGPNDPSDFGRPDGPKDSDGNDIRFRRDLPNGQVLFTHVYWVKRGTPGAPRP